MNNTTGRTTSLELADHDVQVWSADVGDLGTCLPALERLLDLDELARADKYRFVKDRQLFVACRGILRILLAAYAGLEPSRVRFGVGAVGKPYLVVEEGISSIRFNVSHSHGRVLLGFSRRFEIGVDVEKVRDLDDLEGLANRYFAPEERADLASLELTDRKRHFFTLWALKEAFLKGTGRGLTTALDSFYVVPSDADLSGSRYAVVGRIGPSTSPWRLIARPSIPGFAAAVAVEGEGWRLRERLGSELMGLIPIS